MAMAISQDFVKPPVPGFAVLLVGCQQVRIPFLGVCESADVFAEDLCGVCVLTISANIFYMK